MLKKIKAQIDPLEPKKSFKKRSKMAKNALYKTNFCPELQNSFRFRIYASEKPPASFSLMYDRKHGEMEAVTGRYFPKPPQSSAKLETWNCSRGHSFASRNVKFCMQISDIFYFMLTKVQKRLAHKALPRTCARSQIRRLHHEK